MTTCIDLTGAKLEIPKEQVLLRPAAYAIILDGTRLLLVKLWPTGKYHLPGGGIEAGERIEEALIRETHEETGIDIEVGSFKHFEEDFFFYNPSGKAYHGLHFYYMCKPVTFQLLANDEVNDHSAESPQWVEIQNLRPEDFQLHGDVILKICQSRS
jgi:8-oxo-dGTP pyrophosphatase MutT (NUDIX family)